MSSIINRAALSELVAQRAGTDRETALDSIKAVERIIEGALRGGDVVAISKFGKFYLKVRERQCVDPRTNESIGNRLERLVSFTPRKNMVIVHEE